MGENLGVAAGGEHVAPAPQLLAQFHVVVNFAVEDGYPLAALVKDRLFAPGEIHDGQPPHPEAKVAFPVFAPLVGAAVAQGLQNLVAGKLRGQSLSEAHQTRNPAHRPKASLPHSLRQRSATCSSSQTGARKSWRWF